MPKSAKKGQQASKSAENQNGKTVPTRTKNKTKKELTKMPKSVNKRLKRAKKNWQKIQKVPKKSAKKTLLY